MRFFRLKNKSKRLIALLVFGLLLRSLIAPGYMLDTNPADGSLLSIKICEGPGGINAIAGLDDEHSHHHHDHHQHGQDDNQHNHHASQDKHFSACSLWSSSSQSLLVQYDLSLQSAQRFSDEPISYQSHLLSNYSRNARLARAPPALS